MGITSLRTAPAYWKPRQPKFTTVHGGTERSPVLTLDRSPEPAGRITADPDAAETRAAEITRAAAANR